MRGDCRRSNDATVVSLSVVPRTGRADVVVRVDGSVTFKHFTLAKPDKIVRRSRRRDARAARRRRLRRRRARRHHAHSLFTVHEDDRPRRADARRAACLYRVERQRRAAHQRRRRRRQVRAVARSASAERRDTLARSSAEDGREPAEAPARAERRCAGRDAEVDRRRSRCRRETPAPQIALDSAPRRELGVHAAPTSVGVQGGTPAVAGAAHHVQLGRRADRRRARRCSPPFTGRTILPSKNVTGNVTANIIDLPWDVALQASHERQRLRRLGQSPTASSSSTRSKRSRRARRRFRCRTARSASTTRARCGVKEMVAARLTRTCPPTAQAAAAQAGASGSAAARAAIQSFTCPTRGTVTADTITNCDQHHRRPVGAARARASTRKSLDLRQPQVNIKAKIILVDRSTLEGLGLALRPRHAVTVLQRHRSAPRLDSASRAPTPDRSSLGGNAVSAIANASARVPGAALQLVYSTAMGNYDFTTFLEALQTNTLLDVQAEPSTTCAEQPHGEPHGRHAGSDPRHRRRIGGRQHEQRAARPGQRCNRRASSSP